MSAVVTAIRASAVSPPIVPHVTTNSGGILDIVVSAVPDFLVAPGKRLYVVQLADLNPSQLLRKAGVEIY